MVDFRIFVPKEVHNLFGAACGQFVSDNIVKLYNATQSFFSSHFMAADSNVEKVLVVVNNWHDPSLIKILGQVFNWRGLRTFKYISDQIAKGVKTATMSQHVGGSTNAMDINVVLFFKGGKTLIVNSDAVHDLITKNAKYFMDAGLTTLEDKAITKGWTHMDCRWTGKTEINIVKP